MDPREFHSIAQELAATNRPAACRTAISRAYYAALHVSGDFIRAGGNKVSVASKGHGEVTKFLGNCGDAQIEATGGRLADLQGKRVKADYHLQDTSVEDQKTALFNVGLAHKILTDIDTCARDYTRQQSVADGIRAFKQANNYLP